MRTIISHLILLATASVALWAGGKVLTLNVKPGLWEVTETTGVAGQIPIPAGMLEKLTPEQRTRFEDRLKSESSAPKPTVYKRCITQNDVDKGFSLDDKPCTRTVVSSTASRMDVKLDCLINDTKWNGRGQFEAVDSENVKGHIQAVASNGDHTMRASSSYTAKWIGSSCGSTK